jgi:CheY-like chemotaxis protein
MQRSERSITMNDSEHYCSPLVENRGTSLHDRSGRILVVDDDRSATELLSRLLTPLGYEVREENNAENALEAARDFQPGVVVLDYQMPGVHGGEIAWQLAQDPALKETPRVILCSGVPPQDFLIDLPPIEIEIINKPLDIESLVGMLRSA